MKYTVCYAMYCSCEVEDQAIELAIDSKSYKEMTTEVDDLKVTAVFDETGKQVIY